jgi:glycogen debranching enzyme
MPGAWRYSASAFVPGEQIRQTVGDGLKPSKILGDQAILAREVLSPMKRICPAPWRWAISVAGVMLGCGFAIGASAQQRTPELELSRPVRSWEFVSSVGQRSALFGDEKGRIEAWIYPLKVLRDLHLRFHVRGSVVPAENLARTLIVRPESTTIVYTADDFTVREVLFAPVREAGALISFEIDTASALEIEAVFAPDFQLQWPAALGGENEDWDPILHAFRFTEESGRFEAIVGSPTGAKGSQSTSTNYFSTNYDSLLLGVTTKGMDTKVLIIAAEFDAAESLPRIYERLAKNRTQLLRDSDAYYRDYLQRTVSLKLPDEQLQKAYDWARVGMLQGEVQNPFLGEGLIAGYNKSGDDLRPGFAWFFGRDAEWTALALDADGDFQTARQALEFLSKYQRADGKLPHEISQSASFVDWFKTPYAYAAADATPLFIISVNDYVAHSGDIEFARQSWQSIWRAYEFLRSTFDKNGLAVNEGVGTGWIEGGPLYPARMELYQAALGVEATGALAHLAQLLRKEDLAKQLQEDFRQKELLLDKVFWSPKKQIYAYAIDDKDHRVDVSSVLAAVPMWFELLDGDRARTMIQDLSAPDQQTDWGMRILSAEDPRYDPGGYHYGAVWPLFTGWASVGEYRYHRALPAYENLRSNALLAVDGSLGHVTEVLSGDFYQTLETGTPQQTWSAAMVVSPLLSGLLGLSADAAACQLTFSPHIPADWSSFSVSNLRVGTVTLNLRYERTMNTIQLDVQSTGSGNCSIHFAPSVSPRASIVRAMLNGRRVPFHLQSNGTDQHPSMLIPISAAHNRIEIRMEKNFDLSVPSNLPALGSRSVGLRVLSESWTPARDELRLRLAGSSGENYELAAWNPGQISSVEGADLEKGNSAMAKVRVQLPPAVPGTDSQTTVVFHFASK